LVDFREIWEIVDYGTEKSWLSCQSDQLWLGLTSRTYTHLLLASNDIVPISTQPGGSVHSAECCLIILLFFRSPSCWWVVDWISLCSIETRRF